VRKSMQDFDLFRDATAPVRFHVFTQRESGEALLNGTASIYQGGDCVKRLPAAEQELGKMITTDRQATGDQRSTIEKLLNEEQVLVHINPQRPGVELPSHLADNRSVTLRLSRYFKGELFTDEDKVTAELLFGSQYSTCVLPWDSIWGASSISGDEFVWASSAPDEILHMVLNKQNGRSNPLPQRRPTHAGTKRPNPGHLRRVK
jgi:hypothetical protein